MTSGKTHRLTPPSDVTPGKLTVYIFFQAEDVIRDFHVTGVQTCALPISKSSLNEKIRPFARAPAVTRSAPARRSGSSRSETTSDSGTRAHSVQSSGTSTTRVFARRSEERRVGRVCGGGVGGCSWGGDRVE